MLKFNRWKTNSKSDETACSSNGCVGGRNGEEGWPLGARQLGVDGVSVDTQDEIYASDLQKQTSVYSAHCSDTQSKMRRAKPLSVLHVIRDKLKPSMPKSRSLQSADCTSSTGVCGPEAARNCSNLTGYVNGKEGDVMKEGCGEANCLGQCSCDVTDVEKCPPRVGENLRAAEPLSTNVDLLCKNSAKSDSAADLRCVAVKPHAHGGLVLSQLSNIVSVESCMKHSDQMATEGASRLPLSPLSNTDGGLDTPDDRQPAKWTLANELLRLSRYGWYWGPVSREEAEEKLAGQPEGAFLVRDSTDDRYLFSLSFRSSGKTLHTRVEYCNGEFSFYAQPRSDSYRSMAELIEQCVAESQTGIYCYSRGTSGISSQSYPVKLTRPVSRFAQVRTLQYLCRFVIRQHTRVDHIQNLPLPVSVKGWLKENQY